MPCCWAMGLLLRLFFSSSHFFKAFSMYPPVHGMSSTRNNRQPRSYCSVHEVQRVEETRTIRLVEASSRCEEQSDYTLHIHTTPTHKIHSTRVLTNKKWEVYFNQSLQLFPHYYHTSRIQSGSLSHPTQQHTHAHTHNKIKLRRTKTRGL